MIKNKDQRSSDYDKLKDVYRPSHADYGYIQKYGIRDHRGGGRSSARETAMRVAAGAIAKKFLKDKLNVDVFGYINQIGIHKINSFDKDIINHNSFFCPDKSLVTTLEKYIDELREEGDSIGASISVEASNMPLGLGEPVFDKLDADIAHALMSINAVKAVEIGNGIEVVGLKGSVNRDEISPDGFESNNSGGISGGISTGQNLLAKVALKPTSSILVKGKSVNKEGESVEVVSKGRHDPCVGIRAVPIVEAMTAIVLIDHYLRNRAQNQDKPKEFNKIPSEKRLSIMSQRTLYDKIWDDHFVAQREDGSTLMYIDRHLIHEVTSPQAFDGLRQNSLIPRQVGTVVATPDHNVPTTDRSKDIEGIKDPISKLQVVTLNDNCDEFGINQFKLNDERQGIVHVIGPEQGITLPGMTIVCGDSHTSTHGAFGSLAMGIGTSEVEHVLATQCLVTQKQKNMLIEINGQLQKGVTAKDVTMFIIGKIGTAGGTEHVIEYAGSAIENLTMEGRMTLCNMAIEAGARAGMVAPDEKTFDYVANRPFSPKGSDFDKAVKYWASLKTDPDASFNATYSFEASEILPQVTWGTSPEMVAHIEDCVPETIENDKTIKSALNYMGLKPGTKIKDIEVDQIFIGSCTNSRIEDLREASKILIGNKISNKIKRAIVVPGSGLVKKQAESEGLDEILKVQVLNGEMQDVLCA